MTTAQQLNAKFGIKGQLEFREDASSLIVAEIGNKQASASLCLQGAHLMTWKPRNQAVPVIWLSRDAKLATGKSIRGGAPVCWPWFGAHASESGFPGHGYARTVPWQVVESGSEPGGATRLTLRLMESDKTRAQWPHACTLDLTVIVGETLRMELTTENTGAADFVIGEALHTYFQIGDIGAVRVTGLAGCDYWDKVGGSTLRRQVGAISFSGETRSRLYQHRRRVRDRGRQAQAPYSRWQIRQSFHRGVDAVDGKSRQDGRHGAAGRLARNGVCGVGECDRECGESSCGKAAHDHSRIPRRVCIAAIF